LPTTSNYTSWTTVVATSTLTNSSSSLTSLGPLVPLIIVIVVAVGGGVMVVFYASYQRRISPNRVIGALAKLIHP
jgi:K+-transporting ATPase A subunit